MTEIERIIKKRKANYRALYGNVQQQGMSEEQFIAEAIEQYVIKARIEEADYHIPDPERIAELKKGLK